MARLFLDYARCVRTTNSRSECQECVDICPTGAIRIEEEALEYAPGLCIGCAGCGGACPTESFSFGEFSAESFIATYVASKEAEISCKRHLPCLAALNAEYLIGLALEKGCDITLDTASCQHCEIAEGLLGDIQHAIAAANTFLDNTDRDVRILESDEATAGEETKQRTLSRRELFSRINVKDALRAKRAFEEKVEEGDATFKNVTDFPLRGEALREKVIPFRRRFFIQATRGVNYHDAFEAAALPFVTAKKIEKADCTNCGLCYHLCPTGALHGEQIRGVISFDFLHCVGCHSCHDACEPHCLTTQETLEAPRFSEPKREKLVSFMMRQCGDCGMPYIYDGEYVCPRCREMDDEARELVGF